MIHNDFDSLSSTFQPRDGVWFLSYPDPRSSRTSMRVSPSACRRWWPSISGEVFGLDRDVRDALGEYIRARGPRLVRTAYLLTGDPHVAEDVVQNALASMVVSWRRLRDLSNLDAYVYRSIVNARRRWWRRRSTHEIPVAEVPDEIVDDDAERVDRYADMLAVLRTLPPRQRAVVVLRYYEDLSEAETAAVLDCSIGTVKSHASRGLAVLRTALATEADSTTDEGATR